MLLEVAIMEHGVEGLIMELGARLRVPDYELEESRQHARVRTGGPRWQHSSAATVWSLEVVYSST